MELPFTPQDLLGLLAEEDRLRVVAAITLGASTPAEIASAGGMAPRAVGKALARLAAGGLVEGDATNGYRVRTEVLREAAAQASPEPDLELGGAGSEASVLGRFVRGGRLLSIPAARSKRLLVLDHLARLFEPGRRYTEAEVNEALRTWHPDYAALRRYLVDEGFLKRADETDPATSRSVKHYWRSGGSFDVD
jgi:hypothetical protein